VVNRPLSGVPGSSPWSAGTLLARLPDDARQDLLRLGPTKTHPPGCRLVNQGERRTDLFLLLRGRSGVSTCVKVTAALDNGTESLLGIRVTGDIVGELAALRTDGMRSATVTTCSETLAMKITHGEFMAFLGRHPRAWEALCRMIAQRLDWANRRRLDYAGYGVETRLARVLVELVDLHGWPTGEGHEVGVSLNQRELGMLIGARKDAISKAMRDLEARKLVKCTYRHVVVIELDTLREEARLQ
jgi:CRP/FNR family cyclic AMP-dependent transcriptional regulator